MEEKKRRGPKPKNGTPMTEAERQRLSRETRRADRAAEVKAENRRQPSNTPEAMIKAMVNASKEELLPPFACPITESAMPVWKAIIQARSRDDWNEPDLVIAAQLAQVQTDLMQEEVKIREEGRIIVDYLGKTTRNPRFDVADMLSKRAMALMRALHMGGKSGDAPRDFVGARKVEAESRKLREEIEEGDGLLAL